MRKMTKAMINRMLACRHVRLVDAVALGWYCWPIAKKAAIAAALGHVPRALRAAGAEKRHA
jgi:hypothetical protein